MGEQLHGSDVVEGVEAIMQGEEDVDGLVLVGG